MNYSIGEKLFTALCSRQLQTGGMRTQEQPIFKDFDLPTQHLAEEHYVPPKARSAAEIERRHRLPKGSLLAEHQHRGLKVAAGILGNIIDQPDVDFSARLLAAAGLNTAWYGFAQGAETEVMRRRLKLPRLDGWQPAWRPSGPDLLREATDGFEEAVFAAKAVVSAVEHRSPRTAGYKKTLGRAIGNSSLTLACVPVADQLVLGGTDHDIQLLVRQRSLHTLNDARQLSGEIGSHPSIAQLADQDSDLSVYWRRNAPNGALQAFLEVTAQQNEEIRYGASAQ